MVFILGVMTDKLTRKRLEVANKLNFQSSNFTGQAIRNAGIVRSMGMRSAMFPNAGARINHAVIAAKPRPARMPGFCSPFPKGPAHGPAGSDCVGAWLTIEHLSTAGIADRGLYHHGPRPRAHRPGEVAAYRLSLEAAGSYKRPTMPCLARNSPSRAWTLPAPVGEISTENLFLRPAGRQIIRGVSFRMPAQPASQWPHRNHSLPQPANPARFASFCVQPLATHGGQGAHRPGRHSIASWDPEKLGPYLGYLPQDVESFFAAR